MKDGKYGVHRWNVRDTLYAGSTVPRPSKPSTAQGTGWHPEIADKEMGGFSCGLLKLSKRIIKRRLGGNRPRKKEVSYPSTTAWA